MFNQSIEFNATTSVRHYAGNPGQMFNFFASHSRWNIKEIKRLIGIEGAVITILRDPIEVFESGYMYFMLDEYYGMDINQYVKAIQWPTRSMLATFGKNQLLFNLGMDAMKMEKP